MEGHLGCFQVLAITNKAAMDEFTPYSTFSSAKAVVGVFDFTHSERCNMVSLWQLRRECIK